MSTFNDERIRAILLGARAFRVIPFPGRQEEGVRVAVRCLTEAELDGCRIQAQVRIREVATLRRWDPQSYIDIDPDTLQRHVERQVVWRAYYDPETIDSDDPARFFPNPKMVEEIDSVTCTALCVAYREHQEWANPARQLDKEQVDELVELLGKGPDGEVTLAVFDASTLKHFVISTVSALRSATSPDGKSSHSSKD